MFGNLVGYNKKIKKKYLDLKIEKKFYDIVINSKNFPIIKSYIIFFRFFYFTENISKFENNTKYIFFILKVFLEINNEYFLLDLLEIFELFFCQIQNHNFYKIIKKNKNFGKFLKKICFLISNHNFEKDLLIKNLCLKIIFHFSSKNFDFLINKISFKEIFENLIKMRNDKKLFIINCEFFNFLIKKKKNIFGKKLIMDYFSFILININFFFFSDLDILIFFQTIFVVLRLYKFSLDFFFENFNLFLEIFKNNVFNKSEKKIILEVLNIIMYVFELDKNFIKVFFQNEKILEKIEKYFLHHSIKEIRDISKLILIEKNNYYLY